jgi:hypothetical protein
MMLCLTVLSNDCRSPPSPTHGLFYDLHLPALPIHRCIDQWREDPLLLCRAAPAGDGG